MAEISWIKISTNMYKDEKLEMIDEYENRDSIQNIWVKLLVLAGQKNMGGKIGFTENKPYSEKMLSIALKRPVELINECLEVLEEFEMIHRDDEGFIYITNWSKHQNIEGMDKIRKQTNDRVKKHREKKKEEETCNVTETLQQRYSNATEQKREEQKRTDNRIEENVVDVVDPVLLEKAIESLKGRTDINNPKGYAINMIKAGWNPEDKKTIVLPSRVAYKPAEEVDYGFEF